MDTPASLLMNPLLLGGRWLLKTRRSTGVFYLALDEPLIFGSAGSLDSGQDADDGTEQDQGQRPCRRKKIYSFFQLPLLCGERDALGLLARLGHYTPFQRESQPCVICQRRAGKPDYTGSTP